MPTPAPAAARDLGAVRTRLATRARELGFSGIGVSGVALKEDERHLAAWLEAGRHEVEFGSRSGPLKVVREGDLLALDFPARPPEPVGDARAVGEALGRPPRQLLAARDYLALYDTEEEVRALRPDMARVAALDRHAVIASAPGQSCDFVSRFFAPAWGVAEDPVTGSSHCTLIPYWAGRLGKKTFRALQISPRGGELHCELRGDRVIIGGSAVEYLKGEIEVDV